MTFKAFAAALLLTSAAFAQDTAARLSFEVASLKPSEQGRRGLGPLHGGPGTSSPGQLSGTASLKTLLMRACQLKDYQIAGPAWMDTERYDMIARIPDGATRPQVSQMLQTLLETRFGLRTHRESRELPLYALMVAKGGAKLKVSDPPAGEVSEDIRVSPKFTKGSDGFPEMAGGQDLPRSYEMAIGGSDGLMYKLWARRETMEQLADRLSVQLNRPVIDRTDLPETYNFALTWTIDNSGAGIPRNGQPPDEIDMHSGPIQSDPGLTIFSALSQLGLRLEARRGPIEMLIVDRAEKVPSGN